MWPHVLPGVQGELSSLRRIEIESLDLATKIEFQTCLRLSMISALEQSQWLMLKSRRNTRIYFRFLHFVLFMHILTVVKQEIFKTSNVTFMLQIDVDINVQNVFEVSPDLAPDTHEN